MSKENFNEKLIALLKTEPRFVDDTGELIPAAVRDYAWQLDHGLISLLLTDSEIKAKFFDDIEEHWIFNHNTFINYITDKNFLANSYIIQRASCSGVTSNQTLSNIVKSVRLTSLTFLIERCYNSVIV